MLATLSTADTRTVRHDAQAACAATISTASLLPQERIARAPLAAWAEKLTTQLSESLATTRRPRRLAGDVAWISNNAALVAAHQGADDVAWALCEGQIRWQYRLAKRSRDGSIKAHGVQPYINLGRLEALAGHWQEALSRLERLNGYRATGRLDLGAVRIRGREWEATGFGQAEFERFLKTVYVVDSLKALLASRQFDRILSFSARLGPDFSPGLVRFADEASVVAACRLGEFHRAKAIAAGVLRDARGWHRAVFKLRLAETLACAGDGEGAARVLAPLAGVVGKLSSTTKSELQTLYVLSRIATSCLEVGLAEEGLALARDVLDGSRAAGDEAFEIESLRILCTTDSHPELDHWRDDLSRLQQSTCYHRYRVGGRGATTHPALDRLYDRLLELYAA
jgi:hypothetical protein